MRQTFFRFFAAFVFGTLLGFVLPLSASAIVIRHDVDDDAYLASPDDFPPLATFYIDGAHGTLIAPSWVLTAAHATFCVQPGRFVRIMDQVREVEGVWVHGEYTPGQSHDIALVKLAEPVDDVETAEPYPSDDELGKVIWFIGIGGTGTGKTGQTIDNAENKGVLRKAQNKIIVAEGPLIKFRFDEGANAEPLEGVSGGGDSGGPAYLKTEEGYQVLGISSRPEGAFEHIGDYGITEVYSRVSYFRDWINLIQTGSDNERKAVSTSELRYLPEGLTEDNLQGVCDAIGVRPDR